MQVEGMRHDDERGDHQFERPETPRAQLQEGPLGMFQMQPALWPDEINQT